MKIQVTGKIKKDVNIIKKILTKEGFEINSYKPEIVISYGGDGSFLYSERKYPGIPKTILRNKSICNICEDYDLKKAGLYLKKNRLKISKTPKIEFIVKKKSVKKKYLATSDVTIRNKNQQEAIRFSLQINKDIKKLIGDGIVVANSIGATGYYQSITKQNFTKGIRVALNNTTSQDVFVKGKRYVFTLLRNNAILTFDNSKNTINLSQGDKIIFGESKKITRKIDLNEK